MKIKTSALVLSVLYLASCVTSTGNAAKIKLTGNPERVKGCKFLGNVAGWQDAERQNRANTLAATNHVPAESVVVLHIEGGEDEAYSCPATPAAPLPTPTPAQ